MQDTVSRGRKSLTAEVITACDVGDKKEIWFTYAHFELFVFDLAQIMVNTNTRLR